jgi:uncharacterized protein YdcH (DUF465 family)
VQLVREESSLLEKIKNTSRMNERVTQKLSFVMEKQRVPVKDRVISS